MLGFVRGADRLHAPSRPAASGRRRRRAPTPVARAPGWARSAIFPMRRPWCTVPPRAVPLDGAAPPRDGGELVVHVEAEPAILCDLVEHDAWSRWIVENQVVETLLWQDPWSGAISPRLAVSVDSTPEALIAPPASRPQVARRQAVHRRRRCLHHRPRPRSGRRRRSAERFRSGLHGRDPRRRDRRAQAHSSRRRFCGRRWRTSASFPSTCTRARICGAPTPRARRSAPVRSTSSPGVRARSW